MSQRTIPTLRSIARGLTVVALVATAGACGLSANDEPHPIAAEDLPADLRDPNPSATTTQVGSSATATVTVYLVVHAGDTTHLSPVIRDVADATRAAERINALLLPRTAEEQRGGLISSIPTDTVLLDTTLLTDDNELVVNLSGALFDVQGEELANAFAQLVWTVTELEGVRQVRFKVDGETYRAPNAEGIEQDGAVTRGDYNAVAPVG